jgi:hypothetical protein
MLHPSTRKTSWLVNRRTLLLGSLIACLLISNPSDVFSQQADAAPKYAREFRQAFKGAQAKPPAWEYFGVSPEKYVLFKPEGLRIHIPPGFQGPPLGYGGTRPRTGVSMGLIAKGDFEITMRYEFLKEPAIPPAGVKGATRVTLEAFFNGEDQNFVFLSRRADVNHGQDYNLLMRAGPGGQIQLQAPAQAYRGRLGLVRAGQTLSYMAAEGNDETLHELRTLPLVGDDLIDIRLIGTTAGEAESLDVRVTDVTVRAASIELARTLSIVKLPESGGKQPGAPGAVVSDTRRWWIGGVISLLLVLVLGMALLARRKGAAKNAQPTSVAAGAFISFPCPCGTLLKVKFESMGKDVSCPECGKTVTVPK